MPSNPATAYAATSWAKDAFSVEMVESDSFMRRRWTCPTEVGHRVRTRSRASWKLCKQTARQRRLRQLLRDEVARARAQARPGMGARADVPQVFDGRSVPRRRSERPPEEILVERAAPGVDVAGDEVRVQRLEVDGGEDRARECRGAEVLDRSAEPADDSVGVRLAQLLRPGPVADVELVCRIAANRPRRKLLELDPDDPLAVG